MSRNTKPSYASSTPAYRPVQYVDNLAVAHNGVVLDTQPQIQKVYEVLPVTNPQGAFSGNTSASVEFNLPKDMGRYYDGVVQFDLNVTADGGTALTNTFAMVYRTEIFIAGQVVESVESPEALEQCYFWLTDQERKSIAPLVNINASTGNNNTTAISGNVRLYLPLWANCLATASPYVRGFGENNVRIKLWFAPSCRIDNGTSGVQLTSIRLLATETVLSPDETARLDASHKSGACYRTVFRQKFTYPLATAPLNTQIQAQMTSFNNPSAGIQVYVAPQTLDNSNVFTKWASDRIQLRDSKNADLTVTLPGEYYVNILNQWTTPRSPANNAQANQYIFSFCQNLGQVVETGTPTGAYQLTGNERVVVWLSSTIPANTSSGPVNPPAGGLSNVAINAVSFEYGKFEVYNNTPKRVMGL